MPPPLTEEETKLLTKYVGYRFNLHGLSRETQYNIFDLTRWLLQPHIQANLAAYLSLLKFEREAQQDEGKSVGIANLIDLVNTTQDDKERRHAATTLVRISALRPLREAAGGTSSRTRTEPDPSVAGEAATANPESAPTEDAPHPEWLGHRPFDPAEEQASTIVQPPSSSPTQAAAQSSIHAQSETIDAQFKDAQPALATAALSDNQPDASNTS